MRWVDRGGASIDCWTQFSILYSNIKCTWMNSWSCQLVRVWIERQLRGNNYLWSRAKTIAVGPSYYQRATISLQLETRCDYTRIWSSMIDPINYSMIAQSVTHHLTRSWQRHKQYDLDFGSIREKLIIIIWWNLLWEWVGQKCTHDIRVKCVNISP